MSTISEGIKDILVADSVGVFNATTGWAIYISTEPVGSIDQAITVFDTGGEPPNPKWLLDYPSVMVRIRAKVGDYLVGWAKAKNVKDSLLAVGPQTINLDQWDGINMAGDINHIGYDESNRPLFTINFRLIVEPVASALTNRASL